MKNNSRNVLINSYFKNSELYIEIEDEDIRIDDLSAEQLSLAVKEGVRSALHDLSKSIK